MSKINVVPELVDRHSDQEITEYLYRIMAGVIKNYRVSLEKGDSTILWANLADLEQVTSVLQAVNKRNQERLAQSQGQ